MKKTLYRVIKNEYRDSIVLMNISHQLGRIVGVEQPIVVMGTESNIQMLQGLGLLPKNTEIPTANDLIIASFVNNDSAITASERIIDDTLHNIGFHQTEKSCIQFHSIESIIQSNPGINLALVSLPGEFAAYEANRALNSGLNVFMFSDNVPIEQEVKLKKLADRKGLIVMGPECGTSLINGVALGIASMAHPGPVGVVGASGSGLQEIYTLCEKAGIGVSHAIGTGGRDLSAQVGGITTLRAIELLQQDEKTQVLVLVSKKPEPQIANHILRRVAQVKKPVVVCFLGTDPSVEMNHNIHLTATLEGAVDELGIILGKKIIQHNEDALLQKIAKFKYSPEQKYIRGLFTGGTFCQEAMLIWEKGLGEVWSVHPFQPELRLPDPYKSQRHTALDLGDEIFTRGRPHPCIDALPRVERMKREIEDKEVAVIVLDIELGYGSHPDMAGELAPLVSLARSQNIYVVSHVCGTDLDPQNATAQEIKLADAGAIVAETNASGARIAMKLLEMGA